MVENYLLLNLVDKISEQDVYYFLNKVLEEGVEISDIVNISAKYFLSVNDECFGYFKTSLTISWRLNDC